MKLAEKDVHNPMDSHTPIPPHSDTSPPDRILVIGSNSFSGSHFVAHALGTGAEVIGISRSQEPVDVFLPYRWAAHDRFRFVRGDLNHDLDNILEVTREFAPAYIVAFAAQSMVGQSWETPEHWYMTNVVSMSRLHNGLLRLPSLRAFVQISTPEVYGSTSGLVREDAPYNPSTPYAISKAACDMNLMALIRTRGFPAVFTRAANVCGPGQQLYRIIPRTIFSILTGKKLRLEGGGTSVRSFIHIQDVCEGTMLAAKRGKSGDIFHLSTDRTVTIRELVEMICHAMGVSFEECVEMAPARPGLDAAYLLDCAKAGDELEWAPRISLEETIRQTIDWARRYVDVLRDYPWDYVHKP